LADKEKMTLRERVYVVLSFLFTCSLVVALLVFGFNKLFPERIIDETTGLPEPTKQFNLEDVLEMSETRLFLLKDDVGGADKVVLRHVADGINKGIGITYTRDLFNRNTDVWNYGILSILDDFYSRNYLLAFDEYGISEFDFMKHATIASLATAKIIETVQEKIGSLDIVKQYNLNKQQFILDYAFWISYHLDEYGLNNKETIFDLKCGNCAVGENASLSDIILSTVKMVEWIDELAGIDLNARVNKNPFDSNSYREPRFFVGFSDSQINAIKKDNAEKYINSENNLFLAADLIVLSIEDVLDSFDVEENISIGDLFVAQTNTVDYLRYSWNSYSASQSDIVEKLSVMITGRQKDELSKDLHKLGYTDWYNYYTRPSESE